MKPTSDIIKSVNQRLFEPFAHSSEPKKTDAGIVLGGRSTSGAVAREAADLYHEGHFPRIIVAGGARIFQPPVALALALDRNPAILNKQTLRDIFIPATEVDYMREVLLKAGVPANDISVGSRQKHADAIVKDVMREEFRSATVLAYAPYMARTIGTFRHQGEERPLVAQPVNVFGLNPGNWQESRLAGIVVNEARNMDPENPKGYIGKYSIVPDWTEEARRNEALEPLLHLER